MYLPHGGLRQVVSEFDLESYYYVHFPTITIGKGMNPLIATHSSWLNSATPVFQQTWPLH